MRPLYLISLLAILLCSCGGSGRVMDTGLLQKRKHLPGWDLAVGSGKHEKNAIKVNKRDAVPDRLIPVATQNTWKEISADQMLASNDRTDGELIVTLTVVDNVVDRKVLLPTITASLEESETHELVQPDPQEDLMPKKRWNKLAIPAFLAALGTVYLGLFSVSTIAVIAGIAVTLTLAGISLRQIRKREEAGKGFALVALILGLLAALATAVVTAVVGFV